MWLEVTTADEWQLNEKFGKYWRNRFFFSQSLKLWSDSAVLKWADRYFYNLFFFLIHLLLFIQSVYQKSSFGQDSNRRKKGIYEIGERTFYFSLRRDSEHSPSSLDHPGGKACICTLSRARTARVLSILLHCCFNMQKQESTLQRLLDPRLIVCEKGWKKPSSSTWGLELRQAKTYRADGSLGWESDEKWGRERGCIWYQVTVFIGKRQAYFRLHS